nr:hypothetical protein [Rhodococcus sp. MS16]
MSSRVREPDFVVSELLQLLGSWWYHYDEWQPEVLRALIVDDFAFSCRSDTGTTEYEDFIRCDLSGANQVMEWQEAHRLASPYPLRHNSSNVFVTDRKNGVIEFSSYIFVTKIVDGRPYPVSSGLAHWVAWETDDALRLASLEVVLDTMKSVAYSALSTNIT